MVLDGVTVAAASLAGDRFIPSVGLSSEAKMYQNCTIGKALNKEYFYLQFFIFYEYFKISNEIVNLSFL